MAITHAYPLPALDIALRPRPVQTRLAVGGALVCVGAVVLAAAGAESDAAFGRGLLELLVVGVPIAVGLYALRAPINASFGIALLSIGFLWSLTALTEAPFGVPYTIGRLSTWLIVPCVFYLLLAFPDGRIEKGFDRALLALTVAVMVVLYFGTAPLVQAFPPKTLWGTCTTDCPANALFVLDAQPAFLKQVIYVREWLVMLLWLGMFASMLRRYRAASLLQKRAMAPAFVAGVALGTSHYAHILARQLGVSADTVIALSSVWTLCIVAVCVGFLFGLVWRRMLLAQAIARLGVALRNLDDRRSTRDALAIVLRDPTMQLRYRDPATDDWTDAQGRPVGSSPELAAGQAITGLGMDEDRYDLAMIHDVALLDDQELLEGVGGVVLADHRHERLETDLVRAMSDLEDSRRRIAEAGDLERARIERDLHDGAQQRLVALRIRLGMAEELLATEPAAGTVVVRELGFEAEAALDELRSLAHGVYPSLLADRGIPDALRSVATQAPLTVHLSEAGITRHPIDIESATYFTCVEAVQNALKHARGASSVWITLRQTATRLDFEVRDDGLGFRAVSVDGRGLRNMHDRIEAIGGTLVIDAQAGRGARVAGSVPLD